MQVGGGVGGGGGGRGTGTCLVAEAGCSGTFWGVQGGHIATDPRHGSIKVGGCFYSEGFYYEYYLKR